MVSAARPRVGFARVHVTDTGELDGLGAHDDLCARVLYAEGEGGPFAVISLDHMGLAPARVAALKASLGRAIDLPSEHMVFFYSHTHAGIDFRTGALVARLAEAVGEARRQIGQAHLAHARVDVGRQFSVNRRALVGHGLGAVSILFNRSITVDVRRRREEVSGQLRDLIVGGRHLWQPGYLQPELDPEAPVGPLSRRQRSLLAHIPEEVTLNLPVDPHLEWLAFRTPRGRWLGSVVRFSAHPVMWRQGITRQVSADYPGVVCESIEEATGAPALFVNGPCGDVKPLYRRNTEQEMNRVGRGLARRLLRRRGHLPWEPLTRALLQREQDTFDVHADVRKHAGRWPLDEAASCRAQLADPPADPVALKRAMDWELLCWGNDQTGWTGPAIDLAFHLATFNDVFLLGLPTEVWCGVGLAVKDAHPDKKLIIGGNCDVTTNYVPTTGALADGGYEAVNSMLEENAGDRFIEIGSELVRTAA